MAKYEVFAGDIGTELRFDVGVQTADCVTQIIKVKRPDKTCVQWEAEIGPGDTEIRYILGPGDVDIKGKYLLQPYLELPEWSGHGKVVTLEVLATVC